MHTDIFKSVIPSDRLYTDILRRFCWGTDASFYRMVPEAVVRSKDESEVSEILSMCSANGIPVTFRAAGTSLSGQSISDSLLLVAGKNWEKYSVSEDGSIITLQPGIVGAEVNRILQSYGRKFGPDPASIGSCMVGGIIANNASGMSCGTHANSDRMLVSARIVLFDGTIVDTADKASRENFLKVHPEIIMGLEELRDRVRANESLRSRIEFKYSIKNVTGLNILPLLRYDDPFDILAHLMVGSEGTLGFVSEVTMNTLPLEKFAASAMVYFRTISDAAKAVVRIKSEPIAAAELLDSRSLVAVADPTGTDLTAVLLKTEAESEQKLHHNIASIEKSLAGFETVTGVHFSTNSDECARYWAIRSGIFPMVGGLRKQGTTCLIEDIAFHIENLPEATEDLSAMLDRHGYDDSCIYGHALEGNFHFIINQAFDSEKEIRRYEALIRDVAHMVVDKYDGSLKAEHGTGRNMAPFVRYEWGEEAYSLMKEIKSLLDPAGILNPGVIFNDDEACYVRNLKSLPILSPSAGADEEMEEAFRKINKCIECGFCEVNCLTHGLTLSSRTRIAAQREITRLRQTGENPGLLSELERQYRYYGEATCAGDGMCSTSCPMGINTGELTHELRRQSGGSAVFGFAAGHYHGTKNVIRGVLGMARAGSFVIGDKAMSGLCSYLHDKLGIPLWTPAFPVPYRSCHLTSDSESERPKVVYFPSCLNQMMGKGKNHQGKSLADETVELLHKAGYDVIFPENMDSLCCGTVWESKGMPDKAEMKVRELDDALWKASNGGKYPVLCDQSPCLHRMRKCIGRMHMYEPAEFIHSFLRERLVFHRDDTPVAVHQTCSTRQMGLGPTILELARMCSTRVVVPEGVGCCGFAGDLGMSHPEVNAYALRHLRSTLEKEGVQEGYSNSRTCEIGLETNSGIRYRSIVFLVNSHTESKHNAR